MVVARILEDESGLEGHLEQWDRLAVAAGRPYCAPAWALAWWRHARPEGALLRVVVATEEDGRLVGLAPLWAAAGALGGTSYRLLAGRLSSPLGALVAAGRDDVAPALAAALAGADPRPDVVRFEGQRGAQGSAAALADAWPGRRPWAHGSAPVASPTVTIGGLDYEDWLAAKTKNFRQQARRFRRRLEQEGAQFRIAAADDVERFVSAFVALHGARWEGRGGSNALVEGLEPMLVEAARELLPAGRFRAYGIEAGGSLISVQLFISAGAEVSYWNGGFDEAWQRHKPAQQTLLFAIEDAIGRGDRRIDLGPGAQDYKLRMADGEDSVETETLVPRGAAYPLARARLAPYQARAGLSRRLTPDAKRRLRRLLRR